MSKVSRYKTAVQLKTAPEDPDDVIVLDPDFKIPYSSSYKVHLVTPQQRGRLDLIAYTYYGNPLLWWVIANANRIDNPLEVSAGDKLIIPDKEVLYSKGGVLSV